MHLFIFQPFLHGYDVQLELSRSVLYQKYKISRVSKYIFSCAWTPSLFLLNCWNFAVFFFFFLQVLHPAGAGHSPLWTTTFQECDCEWSCPGKVGALFYVVTSFSPKMWIFVNLYLTYKEAYKEALSGALETTSSKT